MSRIALFGGAFDPIHQGHLHIALLAAEKLALDQVYFIPLKQAVHKKQPLFSAAERILKIKEAIKKYPGFELSLLELERLGPSYAIDTVKLFRQSLEQQNNLLPDKTEIDLYYIIGSDAFEDFFSWKDPYKLLELVKFIVIERPGYPFSKIEKIFNKQENSKYLDRIFFIEDKGIDISSTKIREQLSDNIDQRH